MRSAAIGGASTLGAPGGLLAAHASHSVRWLAARRPGALCVSKPFGDLEQLVRDLRR